MEAQLNHILITAIIGLGLVAGMGIVALLPKLHAFVNAHVKNVQVQGILNQIIDAAATGAQALLSDATAAADPNKPIVVDAKAAAATIVTDIKSHLGPAFIDNAIKTLNVDAAQLEASLVSHAKAQLFLASQSRPVFSTLETTTPATGGAK